MKNLAVMAAKFYRKYISGMKLPCCRYYPSCSEYAIVSFEKYGFIKGLFKSAWRVLRCNPLSRGGYDPA